MNYVKTVQAQYSSRPRLNNLIATFEQALNLDDFSEAFLSRVWDIDTCETYGLDCWGKIVGVSRYMRVEEDFDYFGFLQAVINGVDYPEPFSTSPFYAGQISTKTVRLSDDAYRQLIKAKAFANITNATIPQFNKFLSILFEGRGRCYCTDNRDMTMNIVFEFVPDEYEVAIMKNLEIMPIPSGVLMRILIAPYPYFGFSDDAEPFDVGPFFVRQEMNT